MFPEGKQTPRAQNRSLQPGHRLKRMRPDRQERVSDEAPAHGLGSLASGPTAPLSPFLFASDGVTACSHRATAKRNSAPSSTMTGISQRL